MPIKLAEGETCLFCERIAGRRDDWTVIEETPDTIAFVAPVQFEEGQAIVIPGRHAPTLMDLEENEATAVMLAARRLGLAMVKVFDPDGITLYQNNGAASGQIVPHFHMHVVPRRFGSGWGEGPPHLNALEKPDLLDQTDVTPIVIQRMQADRLGEAMP